MRFNDRSSDDGEHFCRAKQQSHVRMWHGLKYVAIYLLHFLFTFFCASVSSFAVFFASKQSKVENKTIYTHINGEMDRQRTRIKMRSSIE